MVNETHIQLCSKAAILIVFGWNIALFTRAMRSGFTRPSGVHPAMRMLGACGAGATILNAWLMIGAQTALATSIVSLIVLVFSQLVFRAAVKATEQHKLSLAFSGDDPTRLNQTGIYRQVRHPFYLGYTLTWLATAIDSQHVGAFLALAVMLAFYITAARHEEKKFLGSPLAADYRAYQTRAGMFFPKHRLKQTQSN